MKTVGLIDERFDKSIALDNQCDIVFQMEYDNSLYLIGLDTSDYSTIVLDFIGDHWQDQDDVNGLIENGFFNTLEQTMVELEVA